MTSCEVPLAISDEDRKIGRGEMDVDFPDSDSDSETQPCEVCLKDDGHFSYDCPYLDYVPDPENTPLGERYHIICLHCCKENHGHPAGTWFGRASLNMRDCFFISEKSADEKPKPAQPTDKSDEGDNDLDDLDWFK